MKKMNPFLLLAALAQMATAQQLVNTTFDDLWVDCYPWEAGSKSSSRGTQPEGWIISNVSSSAMPIVGTEETGADGIGKAVKLSNVTASIGGQNAPGYITLGTPWATAETKMTSVRNADGGVFGGIAFSYHPDAVRLTYKHDIGSGVENMSVIAYLWKGAWLQQDVPSNTAVGVFSWGNAVKVDMEDRIHNILGKECLTGGEVTKSDDASLVASVEFYENVARTEWTTVELPLDYGDNAGKEVAIEKLNIVIASNGFFDNRENIRSGNSVTIDDVQLVYWHTLASLSYEGALLDFSSDVTTYDLSSFDFDESCLSFGVKGQGATATTSYDEETAVLTIRVEGEDIAINENSFTEYKVQFRKEPDVERLIPMVTAGQTQLLVDETSSLVLENCDGLTADYSVPGIISYADGVVTALSEGKTTLILTQPRTAQIEAGEFKIEFMVSRHNATWTWNGSTNYYSPGSVVQNIFQITSGDTSLFSFISSNLRIAKVKDGNLVLGDQTGAAIITIRCRGNVKWNTAEQKYVVKVGAPGHVPFSLTRDLYEDMRESISGGEGWDANGGIRLGNSSEIFSWGNKSFVMKITGIPDKLTFNYSSSRGASGRQYVIYESADGQDFSEIWRDNRGSGIDGNSYWCNDLQLSPDTRFIKFFYYGNCAAYYREISISELVKFEADKREIALDEIASADVITFSHANASTGPIRVAAPEGIIVSPARFAGGMDIFGVQEIGVEYDVTCFVDADIVISNGFDTTTVHVVASPKSQDIIDEVAPPRAEREDVESRVYNLAGQRVGRLQKGINIVNGKKVFVK